MKDRTVKQVQWRILLEGGRMNGGNEGEGLWLMGFIYIYELE
jgi:hypothetical protein